MTLRDPETALVYSIHHVRQGQQDWDDELPPETMGRMSKQEKGKSNFPAQEEAFKKLESLNLDPSLSFALNGAFCGWPGRTWISL